MIRPSIPPTNEAERQSDRRGREPPDVSSRTSPDRAATSRPTGRSPGGRSSRRANIWLLSVLVALSSAMYELFSSWYPTTCNRRAGPTPDLSSRLASMVLGAGACATISGGWLSDWLVRRTGNHRWGRTAQAVAGWGIAAARHPGQHLDRFDDDGLGLRRGGRLRRPARASLLVGLRDADQRPARRGALRPDEHVRLGGPDRRQCLGRRTSPTGGRASGYTGRAQWDPALYGFVVVALIGMVLWALVDPRKTVESDEDAAMPVRT